MRIQTDMARALWLDTITALEQGRPDAMLRVLEVKAATAETAREVLDSRCASAAAWRSARTSASSGVSATRARRWSWPPPPTSSTTSSARRSAALPLF
jgi:hypothetical protein